METFGPRPGGIYPVGEEMRGWALYFYPRPGERGLVGEVMRGEDLVLLGLRPGEGRARR